MPDRDAMIEAAADAMKVLDGVRTYEELATAVLDVVRPLILREAADWLRGDEGEACRAQAMDSDIPPEDALAHELERLADGNTTTEETG